MFPALSPLFCHEAQNVTGEPGLLKGIPPLPLPWLEQLLVLAGQQVSGVEITCVESM